MAPFVRKLLGYRRFEGLAAARAISRPYGASRLFVNFFQPSFKLAANIATARRSRSATIRHRRRASGSCRPSPCQQTRKMR